MANALIISKQTGGYFAFNLSIDGAPQEEVRSIQNDLLTVGNTLHFKTSNGANIIKQQNITPAELTIIASGTFTFATVTQVWAKLIEIGFFDWLGTGGGAGVYRFDDLLDTFQYFGKDGYVCVVNESQQKLEAVPFYNYRKFTDLEDSPSFLVPNKMVVVNPTGTSLILQDQPPTPDTYLNSVGYFDYNDSITHTTPLAFVTNTPKKLTNDTLGVNTNSSENPYGVSFVWNRTNNQFDFSQLSIGDTIDIRIQVQVTTTTANQKFKISAKFGIGSVAQFENTILSSQVKTAGLEEISFVAPFYIGSSYIRDFPAELYITSDAGGTVVVDGWYIRILRKNINILTIESSVPDATTLVKGIVRLGGDLSGTADNPTVPALATKTANTRLINTTAPLSGGGDLSVDRTISIPQANTSTNGYLAGGDWTTFNNKQNGSANLTSISSLSYVSPAFVKMTGLNTFTLDTNTYALDSNVVHKTGTESIAGSKTFTDAMSLKTLFASSNSASTTMYVDNAFAGKGIEIRNYALGGDGTALYVDHSNSGTGINVESSSTGDSIVINAKLEATGLPFVSKNNGTITFSLNKLGNTTANSFIKSGGLSTEYLKADGSVSTLTNPITGTGTVNYLPKFTGASTLGNSLIFDNGSQMGIGTAIPNTRLGISWNASATSLIDLINTSATGQSGIDYYNSTGINVGYIGTFNSHAEMSIQSLSESGNLTFRTNALERMRILSSGNVLIGTTTDSNATLNIGKNITGTTTSYGISNQGVVQSGVTSTAFYNHTLASTQATTFTTSTLGHYVATQGTFGAGSTVTTQYGFGASATIAGATNNYGFTGNLVAGTNNYNLYMSGTAKNYLAGSLLVGTTTDSGHKLQVSGTGIFNNSLTLNNPKDGTWTAGEVLSTLDFKGNDLSGDGVGTKAYVRALSRDTFGGAFHLTFGTDDSASGVLERMRIMDSGNILIGTTTDSGDKLRVNGTTLLGGNVNIAGVIKTSTSTGEFLRSDTTVAGATQVINIYNSGGTRRMLLGYGTTSSNSLFFSNDENGDIILRTNATERINISSAGVVKVNNLSGTGTRTVVADASGILSTATTYTRALSELFVDTSNTVTTEQTLFTYTIPMGTLAVNGDRIELKEAYNASVINTQSVFTFDGVTVFSNTNSGTGNLARNLIITRVNSTTIKRIDTITGSASNFTVSNLDTTNIVLNLKYTASSVGGATLRMVFLTYFAKS